MFFVGIYKAFRWLVISLICALTFFALGTSGQGFDPCTVATTLNSLKQRLVGYNLTEAETPLCDYYMIPGWYSMGRNVIARTEAPCGTIYNWYLKGTLPSEGQTKEMEVCRYAGEGNICSETKTIEVKRCQENEYVFHLVPPDGCPEAYCIENLEPSNETDTPPDISPVKPEVTVIVTRPSTTNILNFFCDFTPPTGTNYFYTIFWGISSGLSWIHTLRQFEPVYYVNQFDFQTKTALTEQMLRDNNFGRLGITLACSVTAQTTLTGTSSAGRQSPPKFFGIEVLNKTIRVSNKEDTTIFLRLTAPFGCAENQNGICSIDLNVYIPQDTQTCKLPEVSQREGIRNRCGLTIRNNEINEWIPLRLTAFDGETRLEVKKQFHLLLSTHKTVPIHPFFGNYFLDPIKVEVHTNMSLLTNKLCYSYNDPHMRSFDCQSSYENQNPGKFLLYRNKIYKTQVQMQTTECAKNIWCNCGVAVSAGRDVFIVNNCGNGGRKKWDVRFRECKDRVLRRKVTRVTTSHYKVYLPTGSLVTIRLYGSLLNVDIAPGLADFENSEGLCGLFDGNPNNDRDKRPGSVETDPNLSWRVTSDEDLFDSRNDNNLAAWQDEMLLCSCHPGTSSTEIVDLVTCHPELSKTCQDDRTIPILQHQCSLSKRKKRNVHGVMVDRELDLHKTVETNFVSRNNVADNHYSLRQVSKRKAYDYDSAKEDCLDVFNTTAFRMCSSIPNIDFNDFMENCILDAQITSSMDWSLTHLEGMKENCIHEIKVNQPLSEEDLKDVEIIVNNTNINFNTTTNESAIVPEIPSFSKELLNDIEDVSCPNECSGNGKCEKGVCVCDVQYIGDDCSIDSSLPPIMEGLPDRGECDLQFRACEQTSVFGTNLADTVNLSCQLVPFSVSSNSETVTSNTVLRMEAELQTFVEVICPLEKIRKKRSTLFKEDDYIAFGYWISVSNDGVKFSEEDILVIFDSECVNCTKDNGNVICRQNQGFCVKKGQCYRYGDTYGCHTCFGDIDNPLYWKAGSGCLIPTTRSEEPKKLWIIAATLCPMVVLTVVIFGLIWCISKRGKKRKEKITLDSLHSMKTKSSLNN